MLASAAVRDFDIHNVQQLGATSIALLIITAFLTLYIAHAAILSNRPYTGFPTVPIEKRGYQVLFPAYFFWLKDARNLLARGLLQFKGCFQVPTGSGYKIIVPNRFADELRSHPNLNFNEAFAKDFFVNYPGFEAHRQGLQDETFLQEVVRVKLTQSLGLVTDDLVEEAIDSLRDVTGENPEWHSRLLKQDMLDIVARLSSRVFLGKELCRDKNWLRITKDYTVDSFMAANLLRLCPNLLRPVLYWFIPTCTRLRQEVRDARTLIMSEVEKRRKRAEAILSEGGKPSKAADAIGWMVEVARGRSVDLVAAQLSLSMAAIHTTSESMTNCVLQLCETPEVIPLLRDEVLKVLGEEGWSKVSLYKMKLLDSFMKEVQRTRGLSSTSMNRMVKKDIILSDGTKLPAGARIMVSNDKTGDATIYPDPTRFDAARFQNLRQQPGEENRHQFVTTTATHMGFGHGQHACPGRFFASNEMKILLCFLLVNYDFRHIPDQARPSYLEFETSRSAKPTTAVQVRRRQAEIDLADLQQE